MGQPPRDHVFVRTTKSKAAAAARIGARLGARKRGELLWLLRPCFARTEPWLQAGKYVSALVSGLPERNGWTIAEHAGDRTPDRTQRLLNRAAGTPSRRWAWCAGSRSPGWMRRRGAVGRRRGLVIGALDETGQEKDGHRDGRGAAAVPGLRGQGGERDQHGAPGVCARACRARADRRPAVDSPGPDRGPGEICC